LGSPLDWFDSLAQSLFHSWFHDSVLEEKFVLVFFEVEGYFGVGVDSDQVDYVVWDSEVNGLPQPNWFDS